MNAVIVLLVCLAAYAVAYRFYGGFLKRVFDLDPARRTPAHELQDGNDFVPARNWWVLFGHHFSSICGAGPIVGPVLACAYWGWGVSIVWIVAGAIWMGAVSDFTSLVMSVRDRGQSVAHISGNEISLRVRTFFSVFLWISLILVIAVFSIFAAKTFIAEPDAVLPSVGLIPVALLTGWLMYRRQAGNGPVTMGGLLLLGGLLYAGTRFEVVLPAAGTLSAEGIWMILLLMYCFAASVLPVQTLLQPRDYIASFILFAMILLGLAGIFVSRPVMNAPVWNGFVPNEWAAAGPLWPMLFVTIACGAISGFHALVSSGTTCKQISSETHCTRIGYGGMLVESLVGVLVLIAVGGGLSTLDLARHLKEGGPIAAFSHGYGAVSMPLLGEYGKAFAVLALNAFILTTLDTATRIARYLTTELFGIQNKYWATLLVVIASAGLAFSGQWNLLWPAFGAANQLIAGITLMIASCWLMNRGRNFRLTLIPAVLMLVTTTAAFLYQIFQALTRRDPESGAAAPDWIIAFVAAVLTGVAVLILIESWKSLYRRPAKPTGPVPV